MGAPLFEQRTVCVPGHSEMHRCVGTTATGRQCKTSGLYNCPQCDAFLCSWHVLWFKDEHGIWRGAHCKWCRNKKGGPVAMEGRSQGGWLMRVNRGWFQTREGFNEAIAKAEAEAQASKEVTEEARRFVEQD